MRTTVAILRWTVCGLLILVLVVPALYTSLTRQTLVEVTGRSMEPTYMLGDAILVSSPKQSDFSTGHVLTIRAPDGSLYTHRVVSVSNGAMQTRGDNNKFTDPRTVKSGDVYAAVRHHIAQPVATALLLTQTWPIRISLALVILAIVFWPARKGRDENLLITETDATADEHPDLRQ